MSVRVVSKGFFKLVVGLLDTTTLEFLRTAAQGDYGGPLRQYPECECTDVTCTPVTLRDPPASSDAWTYRATSSDAVVRHHWDIKHSVP